mgnify:CR=1 FL=1
MTKDVYNQGGGEGLGKPASSSTTSQKHLHPQVAKVRSLLGMSQSQESTLKSLARRY